MCDLFLFKYNLTKGIIKKFGSILGKEIVIWHTSIVAFEIEYYFGNDGIVISKPVKMPLINLFPIALNTNRTEPYLFLEAITSLTINKFV